MTNAEEIRNVLERAGADPEGGFFRLVVKGHAFGTKNLNVTSPEVRAIADLLEPAFKRGELLACLTGSGADAFENLANLIGAEDEEIDAARAALA